MNEEINQPHGGFCRGQFLISPEGVENARKYVAEQKLEV